MKYLKSKFFWKIYFIYTALYLVILLLSGYILFIRLDLKSQTELIGTVITVAGLGSLLGFGGTLFIVAHHNSLGDEISNRIQKINLEKIQLKTMLANMVEGIIAVDSIGKIQFCNRAAYELLDSNLKDVRGMELAKTQGFDRLANLLNSMQSNLGHAEDEIAIEQPSGKRLYLECYASAYSVVGAKGFIFVLHDVTRVHQLERVRRDFVANVSHEIKTPLTNIKGYAETLLSGALDDREVSRKFIGKIDSNAARLKHLVQDILSLATIESSEQTMRLSPLSWSSVVNMVMSQHEDILKKKRIKAEVQDHKSFLVIGNKDAMIQIFDNLLTNAIRYSIEGGRINVTLNSRDGFGILMVEDTGIGIDQKNITRIFERFYRVDKARSRDLGGTGLGLSIVKHLVSKMDGDIKVESQLGHGSKFSVFLKLST